MSSRPNILLLVIDCLRADYVYHEGLAHIPAIGDLMDRGFSFHNAIASTSTTTPSFASLLTGRYPFEHGVRSHAGAKMSESVLTLQQVLKSAGYHTYAEVCGPLGPEVGLNRHFDEYNHRGRREVITGPWGEALAQRVPGHFESPWFLLLHLWSLHVPSQVLPERRGRRYGKTHYGKALSSLDLRLGPILDRLPSDTLLVLTGDHGEEIATGFIDRTVRNARKEVYKFMRRHGLTRKHVSIGYRDCSVGHGYAIYDYLVKVPLILAHDGGIPAGASDVQVRHIDVAPTILEAAGVPVPDEMTGQSLLATVDGRDATHRDAYMEAVGAGMRKDGSWLAGIRVDNRYKYIYAPLQDGHTPELYDLEDDPDERHNVAAERPEVAADLLARIRSIQERARVEGVPLDEEEHRTVMERLRDLGYHDE